MWRYAIWFIIIGLLVLTLATWAFVGWLHRRRVDEELLLHQEEREWRERDAARRSSEAQEDA